MRKVGRAVSDFGMICEGDHILIALSGGKDSWTLLHCLHHLRRHAPIEFNITAVTIHPGFPAFKTEKIERYCQQMGYKHFVQASNIYDVVEAKRDPGSSYCAFCSRLRRGILYGLGRSNGYTKLALGHHADDLIETLLLNQFFTGEIKSMPPVLRADDGVNIVIRPLCNVFEADIVRFVFDQGFPVVCCGCPACKSGNPKRSVVKQLLARLESEHPGIKSSMLSSLGRIRLTHLMKP